MPSQRPPDDDNLDALEFLSGSAAPGADDTQPPPQPPPPPPAEPRAAGAAETDDGAPPRLRCVGCGYPLARPGAQRCSECGLALDEDVLERWFDGAERERFERVQWLVVAVLFLKLLLLPNMLCAARGMMALVAGTACFVAGREKEQTTGGYAGIAGMVAAGTMLLFAGHDGALAFYTLDIAVAALLLLTLLYDIELGPIAVRTPGRRWATGLLFAAPVFGLLCFLLDGESSQLAIGPFPIFGLVLPHLAASGAWLFAWYTVRTVRRMLFGRPVM
jgi:hypothetical protein